ncbi:MltR family transcriptional regulator [uncultured Vibrio sp.]|jgi:mannitol operon repressor|uniref:MltR family transcriptional regulator n=1 Tax=uncultured Vibrio sp. TaxID=114054 RepID=UPI000912ABA0|nr:MltR family transcriptional regulator [uncultured Vibrio sp.]OIQ24880.1 MAG: transcriptional regulator [Vibrio sp. MedPE-SWchi]
MNLHSKNESELLETLSEAKDANECLMAAYDAIDDTLDALINSIFHKDDYAVKYVVDPLLSNDGPLGDILVRCKLLLGLGIISKSVYDDIDIFVTLKEWAKLQGNKVSFTEVDVLFELNKITAVQKMMPIVYDISLESDLDEVMLAMFQERHYHKVKSTITLAVTELINTLTKDNALV